MLFSYGPLKWDFIALKMNIISTRKRIVDTDIVSNVTRSRKGVIMTRLYPLNKSDVIW